MHAYAQASPHTPIGQARHSLVVNLRHPAGPADPGIPSIFGIFEGIWSCHQIPRHGAEIGTSHLRFELSQSSLHRLELLLHIIVSFLHRFIVFQSNQFFSAIGSGKKVVNVNGY